MRVFGLAAGVLMMSVGGVVALSAAAWAGEPPAAVAPVATTDDGVAQARYAAAADYSAGLSGRAVLVMVDGKVVFERYDHGWSAMRPHPLASGTKSFTGVTAMCAVQDGLITLDEKVCDTITEWKSDPQKSKITVRELLTLSSGLDPSEGPVGTRGGSRLLGEVAKRRTERLNAGGGEAVRDHYQAAIDAKMVSGPGERFRYGPSHFYAFGAMLERKLAAAGRGEKTVLEYMHAKIFDPIGLKVAWFGKDPAGRPNLPGGCLLTAREWAKFGQLVVQDGSWTRADGSVVQVIKPELLAECFKPSAANASYGLTWWLRRSDDAADGGGLRAGGGRSMQERRQADQNRPVKDASGKEVRVAMAAGLGKQRLYVVPDRKMVIVRFAEGTMEGQRFSDERFLRMVLGVE